MAILRIGLVVGLFLCAQLCAHVMGAGAGAGSRTPLTPQELMLIATKLDALTSIAAASGASKIAVASQAASAEAAFRSANAAQIASLLPNSALSGVVTIGNQSAGKSSLVEIFLGVPLVFSADETATRCPVYYHADGGCAPGQSAGADPLVVITKPDGSTQGPMTLKEASEAVKEHMLELHKTDTFVKDSLQVKAFMCRADFLSSFMFDLPGVFGEYFSAEKKLTDKEKAAYRQNQKLVFDLNSHVLANHVFNPGSSNILVIAHRIMDDYKNANWGAVLKDKKIDYSRVVVAVTFGNGQLELKVKNGKFDSCRTWACVEDILLGEFRKNLDKDVPIFITTASSMSTQQFWAAERKAGYADAVEEKNTKLQEGHEDLLNAVAHIAALPNMAGAPAADKDAFIEKHIGTDKLLVHVKLATVKAFLKGIDELAALTNRIVEAQAHQREFQTAQLKHAGASLGKRLSDYVSLLEKLIDMRFTGERQHGFRDPENPLYQPSHWAGREITDVWKDWADSRLYSPGDDFTLTTNGTAPPNPDRSIIVKFPFDAYDDTPHQIEKTKWLDEFLLSKLVNARQAGEAVGRLRAFTRVVTALMYHMRPPTVTAKDLQHLVESRHSTTVSLEPMLSERLERYINKMMRDKFAPAMARHFAVRVWSAANDALTFLTETSDHGGMMDGSNSDAETLRGRLSAITQDLYFNQLYFRFKKIIERIVDNTNSLADNSSPSMTALFPLLIPPNKARVFDWTCANPQSPNAMQMFIIHPEWKEACAERLHSKDPTQHFRTSFSMDGTASAGSAPAAKTATPKTKKPDVSGEESDDAAEAPTGTESRPTPTHEEAAAAADAEDPAAKSEATAAFETLLHETPEQFDVNTVFAGTAQVAAFYDSFPNYPDDVLSYIAWAFQIADGMNAMPLPAANGLFSPSDLLAANEWLKKHFRTRLWAIVEGFRVAIGAQINFLKHKESQENRISYKLLEAALKLIPPCKQPLLNAVTGDITGYQVAGAYDAEVEPPCQAVNDTACTTLSDCPVYVGAVRNILHKAVLSGSAHREDDDGSEGLTGVPALDSSFRQTGIGFVEMSDQSVTDLLSAAYHVPDVRASIKARIDTARAGESVARSTVRTLAELKRSLSEPGTERELIDELTRVSKSLNIV